MHPETHSSQAFSLALTRGLRPHPHPLRRRPRPPCPPSPPVTRSAHPKPLALSPRQPLSHYPRRNLQLHRRQRLLWRRLSHLLRLHPRYGSQHPPLRPRRDGQ